MPLPAFSESTPITRFVATKRATSHFTFIGTTPKKSTSSSGQRRP